MSGDGNRQIVIDEEAYRLLKKKSFEDDERMKHIASEALKKELKKSQK